MYLVISINNRCDLSCSFCSQRDRLDDSDMTTLSPTVLAEHLSAMDTEPESIAILGGEPFLDYQLVKNYVAVIRAVGFLSARIILVTNGTHLTQEIVGWANANELTIKLSMDGIEKSQRSLNQLAYKTEAGIEMLGLIRSLKNLSIYRVISNPFDEFALSLHIVRQLFPNAGSICVGMDHWKMGDLNIQHLHHVSRQLLMLRALEPKFGEWLQFSDYYKTGEACDCTQNFYVTPQGKFTTIRDQAYITSQIGTKENNQPFNGCTLIADRMGMETYLTWREHLSAILEAAKTDIFTKGLKNEHN